MEDVTGPASVSGEKIGSRKSDMTLRNIDSECRRSALGKEPLEGTSDWWRGFSGSHLVQKLTLISRKD